MPVHQIHHIITQIEWNHTQFFCINDEISVLDDINEYNFTHQISSELIHRACYDIDMSSDNTKVEVDATPIYSTNETTFISQNYYANAGHNYYAPLFLTNNQEDVSPGK